MKILLTHNDSALSFRVRAAVDQPTARLFLLHGVGGNEHNLVSVANAMDDRIEVVLVRAPIALGAQQYAWFQVRFGAQGPVINPEEADESRSRLIRLARALAVADPVPVPAIMAGFSQGGIMSASVGLSAPEDVSRFAILSGRILPELAPVIASRERLRDTDALIMHGRHDDKLRIAFAEHADQWLSQLGVRHEVRLYPEGHALNAEMAADFARWINIQTAVHQGVTQS